MTKHEELAEVLNAAFDSVFNGKIRSSLDTQPLELESDTRSTMKFP